MYPASPAALLSYLVLRLIECDTPRRQKSQLIQGNKLPPQSKGSHTSSPRPATRSPVNLRLSGVFFQLAQKMSWPEKLRSWIFSVSKLVLWMIFIIECGRERRKAVFFFCVFYYGGISRCRCFYSSIQTFTFRLVGFWTCNTCASNPPVLLYAYCCNLKAQNIQHICHGHFWTPQLKNYASLQRLVVHWGKPGGLQSSAARGSVFTRDSSALHCLFSFPPREVAHCMCLRVLLNADFLFLCGPLKE